MLDADSLRVVRRLTGAHMTFATSVAFSPDEEYILSGSSDASAVLTRVGWTPGGGGGGVLGVLLALLAIAVALLAMAAGIVQHMAAARPDALRALLEPAAPALQLLADNGLLPAVALEFLGAT